MKTRNYGDMPLYSFDIFEGEGVRAFVSTRKGGVSEGDYAKLNVGLHVDDVHMNVLENRSLLAKAIKIPKKSFTCGQQTHSTNIEFVTSQSSSKGATSWEDGFKDTDAMITNTSGIPLMVVTADCAGVFLYDPVKRAIGIAHSGRKGSENNITGKLIERMTKEFGTKPSDILAGIGPCIYPCCYEIDLPGMIKRQLLESGVSLGKIENSGLCTQCHKDIFFSHRGQNGHAGRFANIIMLTK